MKRPLLFDGAFGTYLFLKTGQKVIPETVNITSKSTVFAIHREYIEAGAMAIKTNTFSANKKTFSDDSVLHSVIKNGWGIACEAADGKVDVYADIGGISGDDSADEYEHITNIFISLGATNFLFETQSEAEPLKKAISAIKKCVAKPQITVSFAVGQDGYTSDGLYYTELFDRAVIFGANTVGLNCVCGPAHILDLLSKLPYGKYDLTAMPNSGYPSIMNNRTVYLDNPEYFAEKLIKIRSFGVNTIGGCCGTTPAHIAATAKLLKTAEPSLMAEGEKPDTPCRINKLDLRKGFIAIEIPAPTDSSPDFMLSAAEKAKAAGADFVTIPDSPLGKTHANSIFMSTLIVDKVGIPAIAHLCCRDKNQIAIKGDLLAGNIGGVRHILAITGDPVAETERTESKNVYNFNSFKLISFIRSLNEVSFHESPFGIFAALNTSAKNFKNELERAETKLSNGAECFFTQPLFSDGDIENYFEAKKRLNAKIAVGIMPPASYKNALFLNNEVPGIEIPLETVKKLEFASPADVRRICLDYAESVIIKVGFDCDGYYLMPMLNRIDMAVELAEFIKRRQ